MEVLHRGLIVFYNCFEQPVLAEWAKEMDLETTKRTKKVLIDALIRMEGNINNEGKSAQKPKKLSDKDSLKSSADIVAVDEKKTEKHSVPVVIEEEEKTKPKQQKTMKEKKKSKKQPENDVIGARTVDVDIVAVSEISATPKAKKSSAVAAAAAIEEKVDKEKEKELESNAMDVSADIAKEKEEKNVRKRQRSLMAVFESIADIAAVALPKEEADEDPTPMKRARKDV